METVVGKQAGANEEMAVGEQASGLAVAIVETATGGLVGKSHLADGRRQATSKCRAAAFSVLGASGAVATYSKLGATVAWTPSE